MGDSYNSGRAFKNIGLNINSENININKIIDLAPEKEFAFVKKEMPNLNKYLKLIFEALNKNKDGQISYQELKQGLLN